MLKSIWLKVFVPAALRTLLALPLLLSAGSAPAVETIIGGGTGAALVPLAPIPSESVWETPYQTRQFHLHEAYAKARALSKAALQDPVKSAAMDLYDVTYYDLQLDVDIAQNILTGTTLVRGAVVGADLDSVQLHFMDNMTVGAARSAGLPAGFARGSDLVTVALDRPYLAGETFTIEIDYQGDPAGDYWGWSQAQGQPLVWSLSEPFGARHWWPCKDLNTDKADSVDLHVTVGSLYVVASNGTLQGVTSPQPGVSTYNWRERYPIATYLVSVTIHPYAVFSDTYTGLNAQTMPVTHYVVPSTLTAAIAGYAPTVAMIGAFAGVFGEYPFLDEKYGHAHFAWGGGMEHQTCTSMYPSLYGQDIIAHELAHQWFGDLITCADFQHIWLNEGFATWCEAVWREHNEGPAGYHDQMDANRYFGAGTVYVEDLSNFWAIFDYGLTYQKASWVVHMLRHVLGDEDFSAALAAYRQAHQYGVATTEDLQAVCEDVSGLSLGPFFAQWIYGAYFPVYQVSWTSRPEGAQHRVDVRIAQTQTNTGIFTMPLDVRVTTTAGAVDFTVQNDQAVQWYDFLVDDLASAVVIDPDGWVLCQKSDGGISGLPLPSAGGPELVGAFPNPFNPSTQIVFTLPAPAPAVLAVYDVGGRRVAELARGDFPAGESRIRWDGADAAGRPAASGTYFARLTAGGVSLVRSLVLVR